MTSAAFHCSLGSQWVAGIDSFWLPYYHSCIHGNGWQICRNNRKVFKIWLCSIIAKNNHIRRRKFQQRNSKHFPSFASFPYKSCEQSKEQGGDVAAPPWHAARPGEEEISSCSVARRCSIRQEVKITMPNWNHLLNGIIWCGIWPRQCTSHSCSLQKPYCCWFCWSVFWCQERKVSFKPAEAADAQLSSSGHVAKCWLSNSRPENHALIYFCLCRRSVCGANGTENLKNTVSFKLALELSCTNSPTSTPFRHYYGPTWK